MKIAYEENDLNLGIESFNGKWKVRVEHEWVPELIRNTMNDIRHHYFDNSHRSFEDSHPLVNRYFSRVDGKDGEFYALNNGYVSGDIDSR